MAKADSVPSSTRRLITGESANQSTNLPAVRVESSDRGHFIGGLGARSIVGDDKAALREKHSGIESDRLLNRLWYGANAGRVPTVSDIEALSYAWRLLRKILLVALPFLSRNKRLHFSAHQNVVEKTSSNQLVRSKPQEVLK